MPGARLTREDREAIAALLAQGCSYSEIGRRLGRPTSTISREVSRNQRSGQYSVESAHHATRQRARRRAPTFTAPEDGLPDENRYVQDLARALVGTGMPRMASRIFASLTTAGPGGLRAADLVSRLRVSPASVSKAVAYLESMQLVARTSDPGTRRERYLVPEDVWERAWRTDTGAHARVADIAARGVAIYGIDSPAGVRLARMRGFFGQLAGQMGSGRAPDL